MRVPVPLSCRSRRLPLAAAAASHRRRRRPRPSPPRRRGGSKGIKRKNLQDFLGRPLVLWQAGACAASGVFDAVVVSSDDPDILAVAAAAGHLAHARSAEASSDTASSEAVMSEVAEWYAAAHAPLRALCLAQPTSPLAAAADYAAAWTLLQRSGADSLVTVCRRHIFLWQPAAGEGSHVGAATPLNYDPQRRPRRQDWPGVLVENGAFYFVRAAAYARRSCRLEGSVVAYEMDEWKAAEIDSPDDLAVCRALAAAKGLTPP